MIKNHICYSLGINPFFIFANKQEKLCSVFFDRI
jgi:hypothetical protein